MSGDEAIAFGAGMLTAAILCVGILKLAFSPVLTAFWSAIDEIRAAASLLRMKEGE